jgi:NAD(P)H-dependent FMN reductase
VGGASQRSVRARRMSRRHTACAISRRLANHAAEVMRDHTRRRDSPGMPKLSILIASTRPGRAGVPLAEWVAARAREHGAFDVEIIDLAEVDLPFMDEPRHPMLRQYEHAHTKAWSARVDAADAFVFVTPEYNYGFTAPLKNAIDYLHVEWQYKPVGFVSYGGVAAGTRAVQMLKQVVTTLKMVPVVESVNIPFYPQFMDDDGRVRANEVMERGADDMLDELARVQAALRVLRQPAARAA